MAATGDNWHDLWAPLGAIGAVALVAGAWYLGWLGHVTTAVILATTAAVLAFVLPLVLAEIALPSTADRVAVAVVSLGSLAIFATLLVPQLFPGQPLATLVLNATSREQSFERTEPGDLRVVVQTDMAHEAGTRVGYSLALSQGAERARVEGAFSRASSGGRGASAVHGALSHRVPLKPGEGPVTVKLGQWESRHNDLRVDVYATRCPATALLGAQIALLLLAVAVRRRVGRVSSRVLLVHSALFGVLLAWALPGLLTSAEPVPPLFGAIVLSAVGGAVGGEILGWLALRGRSAA